MPSYQVLIPSSVATDSKLFALIISAIEKVCGAKVSYRMDPCPSKQTDVCVELVLASRSKEMAELAEGNSFLLIAALGAHL